MEAIVRAPAYVVKYGEKDITADIAPFVRRLTYIDRVHAGSDEIEIELDDGQRLWTSAWYPSKGDIISVWIGYEGEKLLPCGSFQIDELVSVSMPEATLYLRGLATVVTKALREVNGRAFEQTSLEEVVQKIASSHDLEVVGTIANIPLSRVTQHREPDLQFLRRLADEYGYIVKIVGGSLAFIAIEDLEGADPVAVLDRTDLLRWEMRDTTFETYAGCTVSYHDPKTDTTITSSVTAQGAVKGDTLKILTRCESEAQAERRAVAALLAANRRRTTGWLELSGMPLLAAGSNLLVTGLNVFDGKYHVDVSRHTLSRHSYRTQLEVHHG